MIQVVSMRWHYGWLRYVFYADINRPSSSREYLLFVCQEETLAQQPFLTFRGGTKLLFNCNPSNQNQKVL